ncbi:hypothetical protein CCACVL1_17399 [Corchorus capsularis]|uniref:Uncharacterized protein n=1 Tax=Corchorus capsularis TaxID=210143 RepID=A0A1R3HSA4_COCAP|nr:hypothetical protein CCACVL1_17399 [Corchorus capsularis]
MEGNTIVLDPGEDGKVVKEFTMTGKLITEKAVNRGGVKNILRKAWLEIGEVRIADAPDNVFVFSMKKKEILDDHAKIMHLFMIWRPFCILAITFDPEHRLRRMSRRWKANSESYNFCVLAEDQLERFHGRKCP